MSKKSWVWTAGTAAIILIGLGATVLMTGRDNLISFKGGSVSKGETALPVFERSELLYGNDTVPSIICLRRTAI